MATCPKCQLPNPGTAETCIWCGQHRFEAGAAAPGASAAVPADEAVLSPAMTIPVLVTPHVASPLVASFVTPTTPTPDHKPLPSHLDLFFARSAAATVTDPPTLAEKAAPPGSRAGATQPGGAMLPVPTPVPATTPTLPQLRPKLVILRGLKIGAEYPVYEGRNVIGRFADRPVDIDLVGQEADGQVWSSRHHAAITFDKNMLVIEDLNSLNGTWVGGSRLHPGQPRAMKPNDVIQIGTVQLKLVVG